jgi:hypothetical protein
MIVAWGRAVQTSGVQVGLGPSSGGEKGWQRPCLAIPTLSRVFVRVAGQRMNAAFDHAEQVQPQIQP